MILFKQAQALQKYLQKYRAQNKVIGFVPTMGALHAGHLSLLEASRKKCDVSVCSIFVNPVQFNNADDLSAYPRTIEEDVQLLEKNGCDILFWPDEQEIYPDARSKSRHYDLGYLETIFEGAFRPGHFQGVCMVVERLLDIVAPDYLFMGQKDYQQCMVIRKLMEESGKKNTQLVICPITREESGLAMSSRNKRLNEEERAVAPLLYKELAHIAGNFNGNNFAMLKKESLARLASSGFRVEYLDLAEADTLQPVVHMKAGEKGVIVIAAFLGKVRLIDNYQLSI